MGSTLYQRQETGWTRKIYVRLCTHLCRSKGQAGGPKTDDRVTTCRELPPDGSGAFAWYLVQAEIKPSTRARYVFLIEHHILPELGSIFVVSLTAKQLSDFLSQKRQSGRLHGGGLSAKSVRDIGVLIKAALRFASAEYHFYCDALNTKLPKAKQREIEPFSAWELDQLRKGLSPSPNHKDAGILLSANGGLRLGEVCALRVSDIDFQNGTVSIERAVQRVRQNGKTKLIIQTPKSEKSVRVIPLPNDMMAYLKKAVSGLSQNAYILTGRTDKPMEPRTYQYYFESVSASVWYPEA